MPYQLEYLKQLHTIQVTYHGHVSDDELREVAQQLNTAAEEDTICVLFDLSTVQHLPENIVNFAFSDEHFVTFIRHENVLALAFIRPDVVTMMNLSVIVPGKPYGIFDTLAEALYFFSDQIPYFRI